jgi:hypothetical protein
MMQPSVWEIREPGLIGIRTTTVAVRYTTDGIYSVERGGIPVSGKGFYMSLALAKSEALNHVQDMIEMGLDP